MTNSLNSSSPVTQNASALLTALVDGEIVALSVEGGSYYHMGETGSRIWTLLEQPATLAALVRQLLDEFDVDAATCEKDVRQFLDFLWSEGLIVAAPDTPA